MPSKGEQKVCARGADGRFTKGNTTGGRKRLPEELKAAFRAAGWEAYEALVGILRDPHSRDADKIRAAEVLLDRGYGKPQQSVEIDAPDKAAYGVVIIPEIKDG